MYANQKTPVTIWDQMKIDFPQQFIQNIQLINFRRCRSNLYRKKPKRPHPLHQTKELTAQYLKKTQCIKTYWTRKMIWYLS